jgi:2,3-bisphosphoglycerate-independent phosphoglycerate mutase
MPYTNGRRLVLVILDGWGIGPKDNTNAIYSAKLPQFNEIRASFPCLSLQASGMAVGLPWNEEGNSEIGHLTIGAGRIVYQSAAQIDSSIDDGSFPSNPVLLRAFETAKKRGSSVCLSGLLGNGMTHSSLKHLLALIELSEKIGVNYKLHLFTDGRDGPPKECLELLSKIPVQKIGSISGRFYAMDRDGHLDRTKLAFDVMTSGEQEEVSPEEYLRKSYSTGVTDEFVRPTTFNKDLSIKPDDSIIFFNFRRDRMKQLSKMFRDSFPNTEMVSMTEYIPGGGIDPAFTLDKVVNSLPKVISDNGMFQLRLAESEKMAHVTYFFNGEEEDPYPNEFRIIMPSKKIASHDLAPEMMAEEITARLLQALEENLYGFILVNYANPDMVGHTGNFNATVKSLEFIDKKLEAIKESCLKTGTTLVITADHGNAERMVNSMTGEKDTKHNSSPVPFIVVDRRFERERSAEEQQESDNLPVGSLCDIAPTVLSLMGIRKPEEMTGQDLTPYLP